MTLFLMFVHFCAVVLILVLRRRGTLHFPGVLVPLAVLLPLWGPVCAIACELHIRGGEQADEEPESGRFGITDDVFRSIRMADDDVSGVLPIEDVLEWGTPVQRRSLLLSVLHTGADPFVRPLRTAGVNDDTEVVHYAVTALVELRSVFAQRLAAMEEALGKDPADPSLLLASAGLDEEYLESGIPDGAERADRLAHCRGVLETLLGSAAWQETAEDSARSLPPSAELPDRPQLLRRLGGICARQEDAPAVERIGRLLIEETPDREDGYMLVLTSKVIARDGDGIAQTVSRIFESGIYLSPQAREKLAFWGS